MARPAPMVNVNGLVAEAPALSVTRIVKVEVPFAVGVPTIVPPLNDKPGGSGPCATAQVYGATPPAAASACEYTLLTAPCGKGDGVVITRPATMVRLNAWLNVTELLSFTRMVKVKAPLDTGVPVIRLLAALRPKPLGS